MAYKDKPILQQRVPSQPSPSIAIFLRLVATSALTFGAFALYAGAVQLSLLYDDAPTVWRLAERSLISNFALPRTLAAGEYRPAATTLWLLTRDLFGWFYGPVLHMWNVWAHTLNTALVIALAARLGRAIGWRGLAFPLLAGALFAAFPFSYQAVLWAGALYHPVATAAGLAALLAYARWRDGCNGIWLSMSATALLVACISHEAGFVFGFYLLGVELLLARRRRSRLRRAAMLACAFALALAYPILYQLTVVTIWSEGNYFERSNDIPAILYKLAYFAQGMIAWMLAITRPAPGTTLQQHIVLALGLLVAELALGLAVLWRARALSLGLWALAWWIIGIAPAVMLLDASYTSDAPRLMYLPSVGVALFWGVVVAGAMHLVRHRRWQLVLPSLATSFVLWCVPFILIRIAETQRLAPALQAIDRDLRQSKPSDTFLLINAPFVSLPAEQTFLFGREGMHLWEVDGPDGQSWGPVWKWAGSVSGIRRETLALRHPPSITARDGYEEADKSFTTGTPFKYGLFGRAVDDAQLQDAILAANYIYRFDYDPPGLRARQIGRIEPMTTLAAAPLARLVIGGGSAGATLEFAAAERCGALVQLHLVWSDVRNLPRPTGVFVHGHDGQGLQTLIADADPVGGLVPLDRIPSGLRIFETRAIFVPPGVDVDTLRLGAYLRESLQRYQALKPDGGEWPANEIVVPIADDVCLG
ncbi:MAG: hypothetical protein D6709_09315 [Chloroflexi bacterium]|jgi:hypothetical protein|uniref:Glycosyltransferase RgtA/B/C/D-like domain-containing protein n=2 Tax=Candidatus Thermofonsia Clade 3 TaxID=2364209 RepID=A0A2M8QB91_9CHLR|nr:MAG: hypothetical protein CUN48_10570 [Candidatus Thermofonsia Clade 3 bacterium]RMG63149.1 MAG: hypothetical protein D6709_09315 [Chloroflexota bacterium]